MIEVKCGKPVPILEIRESPVIVLGEPSYNRGKEFASRGCIPQQKGLSPIVFAQN